MPVHEPLPEDPAMSTLITHMQATFLERGQTLTDPPTAQAYCTTLMVVGQLLDGALATGTLTPDQHQTLRGMVDAASQVPDRL